MMNSKARILVIDDDHSLVRVMEGVLEAEGYEVLTAFDGWEGLQKVRDEKPDVIILDIFMPDVDGYTALSAIKNWVAARDIPVVMVTGRGYRLNKLLAEDLGAAGYITKPVAPAQLLDVIARLLPTSSSPLALVAESMTS
jgi:CheY-like chemotaxis protein